MPDRSKDLKHRWLTIRDRVDERDAFLAVEKAVTELTWTLPHYGGIDAILWAWTPDPAGLALQVLAELVGLQHGMVLTSPLDFPATARWTEKQLPYGVAPVPATDLTLDWLCGLSPDALFPRTQTIRSLWTSNLRRAESSYLRQLRPNLLIVPGSQRDTFDRTGVRRLSAYAPMQDWSTDLTLAVVSYYWMRGTRKLPPLYASHDGWTAGSGPWPGRRYPNARAGWAATYAIDPYVIHAAAEAGVSGAAAFLSSRTR